MNRINNCEILFFIIMVLNSPQSTSGWFWEEEGPKRILLADINNITLREGQMTVSRDGNSVPQLQCQGEECEKGPKPKVVTCYYNRCCCRHCKLKWDCIPEMGNDEDYEMSFSNVTCEAYGYPTDPYIVEGSCRLHYQIYRKPSVLVQIISWIITGGFMAAVAYIIYDWNTNC